MTAWRGPSGQVWHEKSRNGSLICLVPTYRYDDNTGSRGIMHASELTLDALGFQRINDAVPAHGQQADSLQQSAVSAQPDSGV
jgi:hypothetical protein